MKNARPLIAATAAIAFAVTAYAQQGGPTRPAASRDPASAPAGTYALDGRHAAVVARVKHLGTSVSVFRFDTVSGDLDWNANQPTQSKVTVNVDPKSITSSVPGFGTELGGERWLDVAKFPSSSFVSTGIVQNGPTTGTISGNLTLHGVTKPVTVSGELVGIARGMRGEQLIGFSGRTTFKRTDFGITTMAGPIGDEVELVIDLEFAKSVPKPAG